MKWRQAKALRMMSCDGIDSSPAVTEVSGGADDPGSKIVSLMSFMPFRVPQAHLNSCGNRPRHPASL